MTTNRNNRHPALTALRGALRANDAHAVLAAARRCLAAPDEIDATSLPARGREPADTGNIWTWTPDYLVEGCCSDDLQLVPRK